MSVRVYNVERAALVFGPCASGAGDVWRSGTRESPIAERLTPYVKPLYRGRVRETVLVIHVVECKPEGAAGRSGVPDNCLSGFTHVEQGRWSLDAFIDRTFTVQKDTRRWSRVV